MKGRLVGLVLAFVFVGWGVPQAPAFFSAPSTPLKISIALPTASLDFSDLDVRDQFNRPVRSMEKTRQLASLFTNGLNTLLMQNLTPTAQAAREVLNRIWKLAAGVIGAAVRKTAEYFSAMAPLKRFDFSSVTAWLAARNSGRTSSAVFVFENSRQHNLSSILSSTILLL